MQQNSNHWYGLIFTAGIMTFFGFGTIAMTFVVGILLLLLMPVLFSTFFKILAHQVYQRTQHWPFLLSWMFFGSLVGLVIGLMLVPIAYKGQIKFAFAWMLIGALAILGLEVWNQVKEHGFNFLNNLAGGALDTSPSGPYTAHFAQVKETQDLRIKLPTGNEVLLAQIPSGQPSSQQSYSPTQPNVPAYGPTTSFGSKTAQPQLLALQPGQGGKRELGHFLITAPSRAGKGLHLLSNLQTWKHSAIVIDIKGELYRATGGQRSKLGKVYVLDPSGQGHQYDPFEELSTSPEAMRAAANLLMKHEDDKDPIFAQRAANGLYAALRAADLQHLPRLPFLRALTAETLLGFAKYLSQIKDQEIQYALTDFLGRKPKELKLEDLNEDRFLASSWSTLTTRLQTVFSPGIQAMTARSDFQVRDFFSEPTTLYLIFRESDLKYTGKALEVVLLALIQALIREGDRPEAEGRGQRAESLTTAGVAGSGQPEQGGRGEGEKRQDQTSVPAALSPVPVPRPVSPVPILLCLDEATRVEIPELPELVSTVAGRNMSAMIYVQSLSQLEGVYGKSGASTIRDNCHTQIFYGPQDLDTAKYISEALGKYSYLDWTVSRTESFEIDSISQSEGQSVKFNHRELLTPDELLRMNPEYTITFTRSKPPIVGRRLEPWRLPQGYTAVPAPELKELPKVGVFELPQVKREYKELPDLREL